MITKKNVQTAYGELHRVRNEGNYAPYYIGRLVGYLEACLARYDRLETEEVTPGKFNIKLQKIPGKYWWSKDKIERVEDAIIRMTKKFLEEEKEKDEKEN